MTQLQSIQRKFTPRPLTGWFAAPQMKRCTRCGVTHAKDDYTRVCMCGGKKFTGVKK